MNRPSYDLEGVWPFIVIVGSCVVLGVVFTVSSIKGNPTDFLLLGVGVVFLLTIPIWIFLCIFTGLFTQIFSCCYPVTDNDNDPENTDDIIEMDFLESTIEI